MKKGIPIGKLLTILLPLVVVGFLLWPTYRAYDLEQQRSALLNPDGTAKDSVALANFDKAYGEALRDAKSKRIKLGLDLQGGMYVTLEVDVLRLIEETADRDAIDEIFTEVLEKTAAKAKATDGEILDIFLATFDEVARPQKRSLLSYFDAGESAEATEEAIVTRLRENVDEAIEQAQVVVRERIDKYGVSEPSIQKQGSRRIVLELPGVKDESEVRSLLQTTARLEFKLVRNNADLVRSFYRIDQYLKALNAKKFGTETTAPVTDTTTSDSTAKADSTVIAKTDSTAKTDSAAIAKTDSATAPAATDTAAKPAAAADTSDPYAGLSQEEAQKKFREDFPFTSLFVSYYIAEEQFVPIGYTKNEFPDGEYYFQIGGEQLKTLQNYLAKPEIKKILGADLEVAVSAKADSRFEKQGVKIYEMFGLKAEAELTGDVVSDAMATFDPSNNSPIVIMQMDAEGSDRWARITGANIKKKVAIVLDGQVYSAPTVQNRISGGRSQITGSANINEARLLEIVLKAGALKAPVQIIEERVVGPSLGEDSIRNGINSMLFGTLLVVLFMIAYYSMGGLVADLAVVINVLLIIALLAAFGGTLTLPGIAGLILTVGMAVDANILIYERIREELAQGRSVRAAIDEGFGKALSAILDSNITTFITGVILFYFGTGPVQGFAVTLMIGIIMTLFTALLVSRSLIELMLGNKTTFNFGQPKTAA